MHFTLAKRNRRGFLYLSVDSKLEKSCKNLLLFYDKGINILCGNYVNISSSLLPNTSSVRRSTMWEYLKALFNLYKNTFFTPTHCNVCGGKLDEYDYELYCSACFKKSFGETQ